MRSFLLHSLQQKNRSYSSLNVEDHASVAAGAGHGYLSFAEFCDASGNPTTVSASQSEVGCNMEVSWGYPKMENPIYKWMIWGYPHFRKPPCTD